MPVEPTSSRRKLHETSGVGVTVVTNANTSTDKVVETLASVSTNNGGGAPSAVCRAGTLNEGGICVADVITCSTGTVLVSGACVIDTSVCPPGTTSGTFQGRPACVIGVTACSTGTELESGACVIDAMACATNTVLESGACVIATTACATNTVLEGGACVVDATACATGTVLENGACIVDEGAAASSLLQCGPGTEVVGTTSESAGTCNPCQTGSETLAGNVATLDRECICSEALKDTYPGGFGRCYDFENAGC
ncbi:hypothetical protein FOA52_003885 [Chlamydomonas sp. UWO 241]|nr:hypothetical protein FOA52_003885 [Chlamydomonas sp. UWO 241]